MNQTVVGIDLGGTKVALAELDGTSLGESVLEPTDTSDTTALLDQLVALVERTRSERLAAVGVGVPSVVEFESGRVVSSVNIPLRDVALREVLGERLGVPVFVDNDATVAALAEAHDEELRLVAHDLVMLTIGTGVGGGLVLGGQIYRGATGGAAELGHTIVGLDITDRVPEPNGFPQPGSLESLASGQALDRLAGHPGAETVQAAHDGDPEAQAYVEQWAERIGIGVANAINTFDPQEVVLGGGGAQAGELLLEPARRIAKGYVVPGLGGRTTIRLARHGVRAGVLGAALLAEQEIGHRRTHAASSVTR
ncbi:MAG TPA: ROK family protein [Solirubrobacteraceae bacterium]|nr:ROK family protein [Solirubrobacteraceae bacterium]